MGQPANLRDLMTPEDRHYAEWVEDLARAQAGQNVFSGVLRAAADEFDRLLAEHTAAAARDCDWKIAALAIWLPTIYCHAKGHGSPASTQVAFDRVLASVICSLVQDDLLPPDYLALCKVPPPPPKPKKRVVDVHWDEEAV